MKLISLFQIKRFQCFTYISLCKTGDLWDVVNFYQGIITWTILEDLRGPLDNATYQISISYRLFGFRQKDSHKSLCNKGDPRDEANFEPWGIIKQFWKGPIDNATHQISKL